MPNRPNRLPVVARSSALVLAAVVAAACSNSSPSPSTSAAPPSGSPTAGGSASPTPSSGPTVGAIEHSTAATDIVLRVEQGGGFVPIEYLATQAPSFSLYGNGIVVFQQTPAVIPQPDANGVLKQVPWRTATLDEGQIQDLLEFALGQGGLGTARDSYIAGGVADAPDTIFTIRAGGVDKKVVVSALGMDTVAGPDTAARAAFSKLAARLQDFDRGGSVDTDVYQPERSRGILSDRVAEPGIAALDWPWATIKPADFKPGANDGSGTGGPIAPHRTMTADEIAALKLTGIEGGVQGLTLRGPDGKTYSFASRPLLIGEKE